MATTKPVYCHFAFRRPRGKSYGIFACALYADYAGKRTVIHVTRAFKLWKDHQHITAIQAYEHAMYCLWTWQAKLKEHAVTNILLVTDNSTLAGWIENPRKNKQYAEWMAKANDPYRMGRPKEIYLPVGLCEVRDAEKSHKYCREELVVNKLPVETGKKAAGFKIDIGGEYKTAMEIAAEDIPDGVEDLEVDYTDAGSVFV